MAREGGEGEGEGVGGNGAAGEAEHFDDDDEFEELYGDTPPAPHPVTETPAADPGAAAESEDVEIEVMAAHDRDVHANGVLVEGEPRAAHAVC